MRRDQTQVGISKRRLWRLDDDDHTKKLAASFRVAFNAVFFLSSPRSLSPKYQISRLEVVLFSSFFPLADEGRELDLQDVWESSPRESLTFSVLFRPLTKVASSTWTELPNQSLLCKQLTQSESKHCRKKERKWATRKQAKSTFQEIQVVVRRGSLKSILEMKVCFAGTDLGKERERERWTPISHTDFCFTQISVRLLNAAR